MSFPPMGDEFYTQHPQEVEQGEFTNMKAQLGKQTGIAVALLATLLATLFTMGVFSVAQAQVIPPSATRTLSTPEVEPNGQVTVTISVSGDYDSGVLIEEWPEDFTFITATIQSGPSINVLYRTDGQGLSVIPARGGKVPTFTYTVMAPESVGTFPFTGNLGGELVDGTQYSVDTVGAPSVIVAVATTNGGNGGTGSALKLSSKVAGAAVQVVATVDAPGAITGATDIVVDLKKFGVPTTIPEGSVVISGAGGGTNYVGEPSSVTVNGTKVTLALYTRFPGADSNAPDLTGRYSITFKQSAGITNPTVGGTNAATVTVTAKGVTETLKENIQSKVTLSATSGARGTGVTVSAVGIGAGGATVFLVDGYCPDQKLTDGKKLCEEEDDISLGNAESSGGKISVDIDTSSSDFLARVDQVDSKGNPVTSPYDPTHVLRGRNRIAVVDGTGRTTDKDAWFQITPTIATDEGSGKQGDEITILVEDWYYRTGSDHGVYKITVGDEGAIVDAVQIDGDGDGEIDIRLPNAARLGEQQLKVFGSTYNQQGSLAAGGRDAATGSVIVDALDIELDPDTVVLGQQFTIKVKGFSDDNPPANTREIQYVTVGDIDVAETTGGVLTEKLTIDTNGDFTNTFVIKSTYVDRNRRKAEDELDPGTYRVEVKDHTGRIAIGHLTFPEPEITIDPPVGRRGTTVTVVGKNFPAGRVVSLYYDEDEDDDLLSAMLADSSGRFRSSFTVPSNAEIGEEQDILAISAANSNKYKAKAVHSLPPQELVISPENISAGGRLTIEGHNMPLFTLVHIKIADITVSGQGVETDGLGSFTIEEVLVPQLRPGSHTVEAMVATQGDDDAKVRKVIRIVDIITRDSEESFEDLIDNGTLTRVWYLDRQTQAWSFFDPSAEFAEFNTLQQVSSGQIVTIIMSAQDTFQGEALYPGSNPVAIE